MKTIKTILNNIFPLIAGIFLVLFIQKSCKPDPEPQIITKIDTVLNVIFRDYLRIDTVIQSKYIPIIKNDTIYIKDTIYITQDVVNDFFASVFYSDTIQNDSLAKIIINDTIEMNRLKNRLAEIEIYNYTKIVPEKYLFRGSYGSFYMNYDTINVLGANLSIQLKKMTITGGYGKDLNKLFEENNNVVLISLQKNFDIKRK